MAEVAKPPVSALKTAKSHRKHFRAQLSINVNENPPTALSSKSPSLTVNSSPWSRKLILTLDGGGVRGYSSLVILRALMEEIADIERKHPQPALSSAATDRIPRSEIPAHVYREGQYLPSHYFDYVAGTSYGGLIAIMLGMLGMSVNDCIKEFRTQNDAIPLTLIPPGSLEYVLLHRRTTWPPRRTKSFYESFARFSVTSTSASASSKATPSSPSSSSSVSSFKKDAFQCQTLAWCTEVESCKPYAFRSYEDYEDEHRPISVPEVAKAITTPGSASFKPFKLGAGHFVDGSKQIRDPTLEVMKEISNLLDSKDPAIDLLLSLGTDEHHSWIYELLQRYRSNPTAAGDNNPSKKQSSKTSCPDIDAEVGREKGRSYQDYHRFEVPDIRLGFRRKFYLRDIEQATDRWLTESTERRAEVRRYAETLVLYRRARAATPDWEKFALGVRYLCFHEDCAYREKVFDSRGKFKNHLDRCHGLAKDAEKSTVAAIETELAKGRRIGYEMGMAP